MPVVDVQGVKGGHCHLLSPPNVSTAITAAATIPKNVTMLESYDLCYSPVTHLPASTWKRCLLHILSALVLQA